MIAKRDGRRLKALLFGLVTCLLLLTGFFWQKIVASSPWFFGYRGPDLFGIYTARLDGSGVRSILFDANRELSHPRVSPDGKRITFTRYNRLLGGGIAEENGSDYLHTEVVIADIDGSHQLSIEPTAAHVLNANSSWVDNDSVLYVHRSDLTSLPELKTYHLSSRRATRVPTPAGLAVSDPHCVNGRIVFPVVPLDLKAAPCCLYTMKLDGSDFRQLTAPKITPTSAALSFKLGDYDPWFSPSGDTVVFMRYFGGADWRIFSVNVSTGAEQLLTRPGETSAIPEWSSDGKSIIFANFDKTKLENLGLYTMAPSGLNKQKIPLPGGYLYTHPGYFPGYFPSSERGAGSGAKSDIIYGARRVPGLPGGR